MSSIISHSVRFLSTHLIGWLDDLCSMHTPPDPNVCSRLSAVTHPTDTDFSFDNAAVITRILLPSVWPVECSCNNMVVNMRHLCSDM